MIERKYIDEYIIEKLNSNRKKVSEISNVKYHHNSSYNRVLSILEYGILSLDRIRDLGIVKLTQQEIEILRNTTSHINGTKGISLSVVGIEDLYVGEEEYNSFISHNIDFVITDNMKTSRATEYYDNDFITFNNILLSEIKASNFRIIKFIDENIRNKSIDRNEFYSNLIYKYNTLLLLAKNVKRKNLKIQFREMSKKKNNSNIDGLCKMPF